MRYACSTMATPSWPTRGTLACASSPPTAPRQPGRGESPATPVAQQVLLAHTRFQDTSQGSLRGVTTRNTVLHASWSALGPMCEYFATSQQARCTPPARSATPCARSSGCVWLRCWRCAGLSRSPGASARVERSGRQCRSSRVRHHCESVSKTLSPVKACPFEHGQSAHKYSNHDQPR